MRRCARCGAEAAVFVAESKLPLCRDCFIDFVRWRASWEIRRWRMWGSGDRLLLAVSGGKDSFTLLDVIVHIHDPARMVAVTVDEGIPGGYHVEEARVLEKYAREYGVDYIYVSFAEEYGATLEEMVRRARERGLPLKPCTICGVLRRRLLEETARRLGCTRVVTAHNLDDEAQTIVMNVLRGDIVGLARQHPVAWTSTSQFIPRVKPLRSTYEWESTVYAYLRGYPIPGRSCPYLLEEGSFRLRVRLALYRVEWSRPGVLLRMLRGLDYALEPLARGLSAVMLPRCERCGAPTSPGRRICKACEILEKLGLSRP